MTTPQNTDLEALQAEKLLRYLAGGLDEEEIASLSEAMRTDESLRRVFADMLLQHVHLAEIGREIAAARARRRAAARNAAFAAAAAVLVAVAGWVMLRGGYPPPQASGTYRLAEGTRLSRGATLMTGEATARLVLGAYCRLDLAPHTILRIEGKKRDESVFLEKGGVVCDVSPRAGAFTVCTRIGTVSVTGTGFEVQVLEKQIEGDEGMMTKSSKTALVLAVSVMSGGVSVQYGGRTYDLGPGATRVFAEEKGQAPGVKESSGGEKEIKAVEGIPAALKGFQGIMSGTLVKKGDSSLVFKVEKILRTWDHNKAKEPKAAAGLAITVNFSGMIANMKNKLMSNYRDMKPGDSIEIDAADQGGRALTIQETLEKTGAKKE